MPLAIELKRMLNDEKKEEIYIYRKERMNLHFNKTKIFSKDFYLQHKSLPCYSSHWLGSGQPTTKSQMQKCLSCSEKGVNCLTFGLQPTT